MPLLQPGQEDHPDFSAHPDYQLIFHTLLATGQGREQVTAMLADLWRANRNALQVDQQPQAPQPPPPQQEPAEQHEPQQPDQAQPPNPQPHQQPRPDPEEHPEIHPRDIHQGPAPPPFPDRAPHAPINLPPIPGNNPDPLIADIAGKRVPQLPPIDLDAESLTMSLQHPTSYAIEKFRKFEYVPLWYFTEQGCQATDKEKVSNEDLWDVTRTSDNRLALCTAASNRPSPNALNDEQLTWEQFMDANHLLCRWLIPAGWPLDYAKIISSFFWQIENHEDKSIPEGKDTLLVYQARVRKAWHDELKAGHFFNLAKLSEKKMNSFRKEVDVKHNAILRKAVSFPFLQHLSPTNC